MKRAFCLVLALLLAPAIAAADDYSAMLAGGGGAQGFASIRTGSGTVSYSLVTNGIGNITGASIRQGANTVVNLGAGSSSGSDAGSVASGADLSVGGLTVQVTGTTGTVGGALVLAAAGGNGGGGDDTPGTLALGDDESIALERDGSVALAVTRSGGTDGAVTVEVVLASGTATAGTDFAAATQTVSFADGEGGSKAVVIAITDDAEAEDAETFTVTLANATGGATVGNPGTATVTVFDNDSPCIEDGQTLCLNGDRFEVRAEFDPPNDADTELDPANAVELTDDTGYLWFFNQQNVEAVVKVLDACGVNNHYWVFAGGLTNVEVEITVRDTQTGSVATYANPQQTPFQPIQDTSAFATCP
ncbi:MAG TPA: Calx-beta domain-containing protein [Thermoanaerobaculia bacterium]|nr:Calx-beta domain-containing protein [Thermoanaerobaculia bacterium]